MAEERIEDQIPGVNRFDKSLTDPSMRDAYLKEMSKTMVFGRLFREDGSILKRGGPSDVWIEKCNIVPEPVDADKRPRPLDAAEIVNCNLALANVYADVASRHAVISSLAALLEHQIESEKTEIIEAELSRYAPGGDSYDSEARVVVGKKPTKEALSVLAERKTLGLRALSQQLKTEYRFFELLMASLAEQRRGITIAAQLMEQQMRSGL